MKIFVFTASNQSAQKHLKDTVEYSVDESKLREYLSDDDFNNLKRSAQNEGYYCWGATPGPNNERNWTQIEAGDRILSYWNSEYHHLSTIIYKVRNANLATKLWGTLDGSTWEFMYFFKKPIEFKNPKSALETSEYLQSKYFGFAKIKEEKVDRIMRDFGSLENLFNSNSTSSPIAKPPTQTPNNQEMNILTAIKTKPFILLAGISGTGKSRLVRTLAYKTCSKEALKTDLKKPGNFELIPVRPNWHDSSELMGYVSRINGEKYITTSFLQFIAKAWKNSDVPFFLCLDEMNLAPVEQYFAEYLSIIETRQVQNEVVVTDFLISKASFENQDLYAELLTDLGLNGNPLFNDGISIPNNLIVVGTVNMDETTHSFSRKVLDRAMTFEMNNVDLTAGLDNTKNDWSYPQNFISSNEVLGEFTSGAEVVNEFAESKKVIDFLINLNTELDGSPFKIAYRVRDEFLIYCYYASFNPKNSNWLTNALDEMTSMKILSRIEGDETKTGLVLRNLQRVLTVDYKKSNAKLKEMETRLLTSGYTSFWS